MNVMKYLGGILKVVIYHIVELKLDCLVITK